ncbi:MAG: GIY-YIG nuclease family protein [Bacteroidales bacterium]|nr:GIY-YIG nuclease family protein [Bacteroidales bacterium]MBN2755527.1 GIY-YIG nuclease family protein [Bacteroidales bacterium]
MDFFVYILYSISADKFYTGSTNNLEKRLLQHNSGYSKYTKSGIPWDLVYFEEFNTIAEAFNRENEIKAKKS